MATVMKFKNNNKALGIEVISTMPLKLYLLYLKKKEKSD